MHPIQQKLLNLSHEQDLGKMSLRQIAKIIEQDGKPQLVKYHLLQLEKMGMIKINMAQGVIKPIKRGFGSTNVNSHIYSLPIVGAANCGDARIFAEERIEGHLRVASSMLPRKKNDLYVLIADGSSMNEADVGNGKTIEDGDFVIVDGSYKNPRNGDIIVSVIDGMANLKRFKMDKINKQITLQSESTEKHLPIFIHEGDDFVVSGKVIDVIKMPTNKK
jgi:SOS-response transcriptional repressor LexA